MGRSDHRAGYLLAGLLGVAAGGAGAIIATRAIPKMMSRMMSGIMQGRMAEMQEMGCTPPEI